MLVVLHWMSRHSPPSGGIVDPSGFSDVIVLHTREVVKRGAGRPETTVAFGRHTEGRSWRHSLWGPWTRQRRWGPMRCNRRAKDDEILRPWRDGPDDRRSYHHGNLKEALLEAARRFIAERGIGGFTLVEAARLVGVTPAALYRHFRGREALLEELAGRGFAELAARLARALTSRGTPLERFTRMGETYLAFAEEEPAYYAAIFETRGFPTGGADLDTAASDAVASRPSPFDLLVEALQATFSDGFGGVAPRFIALEVWALAHGLATLSAAGHLPRGPGFPDKYELLRAGVLALVHGASRQTEREGGLGRP